MVTVEVTCKGDPYRDHYSKTLTFINCLLMIRLITNIIFSIISLLLIQNSLCAGEYILVEAKIKSVDM